MLEPTNIPEEQNNRIGNKVSHIPDVVSPVYIVCSAILFDDGEPYEHQPVNIKTGHVICGLRHHNCFMTLKILGIDRKQYDKETQGFLTSNNRFVDRIEGQEIAFLAGQIKSKKARLYSEDIY